MALWLLKHEWCMFTISFSTEGAWDAEEGLGRRRFAIQRAAVRSLHVRHPVQRRAVLRLRPNSPLPDTNTVCLFTETADVKSTFTWCVGSWCLTWRAELKFIHKHKILKWCKEKSSPVSNQRVKKRAGDQSCLQTTKCLFWSFHSVSADWADRAKAW